MGFLTWLLGTAFLDRFQELGWAERQDGSRIVGFLVNRK